MANCHSDIRSTFGKVDSPAARAMAGNSVGGPERNGKRLMCEWLRLEVSCRAVYRDEVEGCYCSSEPRNENDELCIRNDLRWYGVLYVTKKN